MEVIRMSLLMVENLSHGFGDKVLFKNVNFKLVKGEKVGLVGNNGTGKSTLLNILAGALLCDSGEIKWASSIKIGYLEQHSKLDQRISIIDTLRDAFRRLYGLEKEIQKLSEGLINADQLEIEKTIKRMGTLQEELEREDFYTIDTKINNVIMGLGINAFGVDTTIEKLSGGQRTKVMLAKLLLSEAELLLLDEPTNYLDKEHVEWLSQYLKSYKNSYILISHDTQFLNGVVNIIYQLEFTTLNRYPGNYEYFTKQEKLNKARYIEQYNRQQDTVRKMEQFVRSNIVRASTTKRAQSRQKQLDKIERLEKPKTLARPKFYFKTARESGSLIFESRELSIGYHYPVMQGLNFKLEKKQKIAITGCNGIGKTTLLKTIMGILPELKGNIKFGEFLFPAYYEQELHNGTDETPMEYIWSIFPNMQQKDIRRALAQCGLKEEHIFENMSKLSGGEQSRVRLCGLTLTESNWLLLDEPTNHLDVGAKEELKDSLIQYDGSIILVCHEKEFYEGWIDQVWNMEQRLAI
jgi:ATPase subunit of ABC transporter with duplicated ATPase domains